MLDSIYHMTNTLKSHFWHKNVMILSSCTQCCYGRHSISRKSVTSSGISILLHGSISLQGATSYDKAYYYRTIIMTLCDITPCNKIDKPLVVYRFCNVR